MVNAADGFKLLGQLLGYNHHLAAAQDKLVGKLSGQLDKLAASHLSDLYRISALSLLLRSLVHWEFQVYPFNKTFIDRLDKMVRKKIKSWIGHPPSGNVDVYYLPQRLCGLGVPNIFDLFEEAQTLATHTLTHSSDVQIQQLIGQERAQAHASRERTAATQARFDAEHAADGDSKRRQTQPRQ